MDEKKLDQETLATFKANTKDLKLFFGSLKKVLDEAPIEFSNTGIYTRTMNPSQISMVILKCKTIKSTGTCIKTINIVDTLKLLGCFKGVIIGEIIKTLKPISPTSKTMETRYCLTLKDSTETKIKLNLDEDETDLKFPNTPKMIDVSCLSVYGLKSALKKISLITTHVIFEYTPKAGLTLIGAGDVGNMEVKVNLDEELGNYQRSMFPVKELLDVVDDDLTQITLKSDSPIKILNSDGLEYYLAPRVEST